MRLVTCLCVASLLASVAPAQSASTPPGLLGTWEALDPPRGIGVTLNFAGNGSVTASVGVIVNDRYTREGSDEVMIVRVTGLDGTSRDMTVMIDADTLTQYLDDSVVRMIRVRGSGPATGLVGKWRFAREVEGTTVIGHAHFTTDGRMRVRVPLQSLSGTYSVAGNDLTLSFPPDPEQRGRFSLAGDTLTIEYAGRPRDRFVRAR